jgi:mannose-1-phosphate guanylyltransferase / phosphomannomutase
MKLFINAGGRGERLRPITDSLPKPMVEILGKPVLHYLVDWARNNGVFDIVMMEGYKAGVIYDYFGNGSDFGVNIVHSVEDRPLGSGGALRLASKYVDGRFAYISGDHICEVDLERMNIFHQMHGSDLTALVHESSHPEDSDILEVGGDCRVKRFCSKRDKSYKPIGNLSNSGLCILEQKIIELMDEDVFEFEGYLYERVLGSNLKFFAYNTSEFMADMGTMERLKKCEDYLSLK